MLPPSMSIEKADSHVLRYLKCSIVEMGYSGCSYRIFVTTSCARCCCSSFHPSKCSAGEIGEHPIGIPNNLMPYIQQVALGQRPQLSVFGHDYPTSDGTCVRDYIHVMDLAEGHSAALSKLLDTPDLGCVAYNLGTGTGTSVLEMIKARVLCQQLVHAKYNQPQSRQPVGRYEDPRPECHVLGQGSLQNASASIESCMLC